MAIERIVEAAKDALEVDQFGHLADLGGGQDARVEPHVAVLGAFGLQQVEALGRFGQCDAADVVEAAGHAGDLFQFLIETNGIALKRGHVGVGVHGVEAARGVPSGAGGELGTLEQHDVGPAELGEVVEHRTADDAAADDADAGGGFHHGDSLCFQG